MVVASAVAAKVAGVPVAEASEVVVMAAAASVVAASAVEAKVAGVPAAEASEVVVMAAAA